MKYAVTICTLGSEVGANPLWHASFMLSQWEPEENQPMKVVETWGFYGVPSTGDKKSWSESFKRSMGMDLDLKGNHGWLVQEQVRYLDAGHGLHGYTFELTQEQFAQLREECQTRTAAQQAAVDAARADLHLVTPSIKKRHYSQEIYSKDIYRSEQAKAAEEGRESRLKPFDLYLSWGLTGPSLNGSHTCLTQTVEILGCVLSKEQLEPFTRTSLPRKLQDMERIITHSTGPINQHINNSGKVTCFRDGTNPEVEVFFTVPPQNIVPLPGSNINDLLAIDKKNADEVKDVVSKLQRLEWLFRNTSLQTKPGNYSENKLEKFCEQHLEIIRYERYKEQLIQSIVSSYKNFSIIKPKQEMEKVSVGYGSFFSQSRNKEQEVLSQHIKQAKFLFNELYMAIVDEWEVEPDENTLAAVAVHLPKKEKIKLCEILGCTYCESFEPKPTVAFN